MSAILGYTGKKPCLDILANKLKIMEHSGYDTAGICINDNNVFLCSKLSEHNSSPAEEFSSMKTQGTTGIAQLRWAANGIPCEDNIPPHVGKYFSLAFDGVMENYYELNDKMLSPLSLRSDGLLLLSLLEQHAENGILEAMKKILPLLKGSYALAVTEKGKNAVYCAAENRSLLIGQGKEEACITTDIRTLADSNDKILILDSGEKAAITPQRIIVFDRKWRKTKKAARLVSLLPLNPEKTGFKHYMEKEIFQQGDVIENTVSRYLRDGRIALRELKIRFDKIKRVYLLGCGSAYHLALSGAYNFESLTDIPSFPFYAEEFRYANPIIDKNTLIVAISQSGETTATVEAVKKAKKHGAKTIGIANSSCSSLTRECRYTLLTPAGPEIALATTKAFTGQYTLLILLALYIGGRLNVITELYTNIAIKMLLSLPDKIRLALKDGSIIASKASLISDANTCIFTGRNVDWAMALEGSLKLREISGLNAAAYPAGELKHSTISLINNTTLVVALISNSELLHKTVADLNQAACRGARVIIITTESLKKEIRDFHDFITYPDSIPLINPVIEATALQLLAYHTAQKRGLPIDKPRNAAKYFTVD